MKTKLIFLGHSLNIQRHLEICELTDIEPVGFVDKHYYGSVDEFYGVPVIGDEDDIERIIAQYDDCVFFVGCVFTAGYNEEQLMVNKRRKKMIDIIKKYNLPTINLIHPSAVVGKDMDLGTGIFIDAFTRVQNGTTVKDYAFIKEQCCVTHHAEVGFNTTVCQQSYIGSYVTIGADCYIGIKGTLINPYSPDKTLTVGDRSITHPGVILMKSMPPASKARMATSNGSGIYPLTLLDD